MEGIQKKEVLLKVYLTEYAALKDEQRSRIGFRDNLIYTTLAAIGGIIAYAISDPDRYPALLILPILCFVLGWTYLLNDEKITSIRVYVRKHLSSYVKTLLEVDGNSFFDWEYVHRGTRNRVARKILQLVANELLFCVSGLLAVLSYFCLSTAPLHMMVLGAIDVILLVIIGIEIVVYSDIVEDPDWSP